MEENLVDQKNDDSDDGEGQKSPSEGRILCLLLVPEKLGGREHVQLFECLPGFVQHNQIFYPKKIKKSTSNQTNYFKEEEVRVILIMAIIEANLPHTGIEVTS